ncbi:MAG TPA: 50S ribosomal protein L9 [Baekduia sp.]|nr:50S ribosomal protein L9 [Baekduia sp.]
MPEVILLQDVENLGAKGAVVDVSKGYLRNYLVPRKLAQPATKGLLAEVQRQVAKAQQSAAASAQHAQELAEQLGHTILTIEQQAGEDGRLFGSVTNQDIAEAIQEARGVTVDRRHIHLEQPIKTTGTHEVVVELAPSVTATVKVMVTER